MRGFSIENAREFGLGSSVSETLEWEVVIFAMDKMAENFLWPNFTLCLEIIIMSSWKEEIFE